MQTNAVFVVVEVQAGVAVGAQCFSNRPSAERQAELTRAELDENDDDVQVFETTIREAA